MRIYALVMEVPGEPKTRAAWAGPELHEGRWTHPLSDAEAREGSVLIDALAARGESATWPAPEELPLGDALQAATATSRRALRPGRGFVLVRGVPIDGAPEAATAGLYALLGTSLKQPVPKNLQGERLCHVRDTGADPAAPARGCTPPAPSRTSTPTART